MPYARRVGADVEDHIVIVGSRSVVDRPDAIAWARARIAAVLATMPDARVLTGDASGVDALAIRAGRYWTMLGREGGITHGAPVPPDWPGMPHGDFAGWWIGHPHGPPRPEGHAEWKARLLARDRALADYARGVQDGGGRVVAVGLVVPWSRTHGTEYTVRQLLERGVKATVEVFDPKKVVGDGGL